MSDGPELTGEDGAFEESIESASEILVRLCHT